MGKLSLKYLTRDEDFYGAESSSPGLVGCDGV
jgi:hypothetical protein